MQPNAAKQQLLEAPSSTEVAYSLQNPRYCHSCRKALSVCLCSLIQPFAGPIPTSFYVHPREIPRARSTSWLAHRMIRDSHFLREDESPNIPLGAALLFPGENARPWNTVPFSHAVVVDGTWDECKAMILRSPQLQKLPRICLQQGYRGGYIARHAPWPGALCTAEALGYLFQEMGCQDAPRLLELVETLNQRELVLRIQKFGAS